MNILDSNMDDVSVKDPLLAGPLNYKVELAHLENRTNDKGTNMLSYRAKTIEDAKSVDGETIPAGRTIFGQIILSTSEKRTEAAVKRDLQKFKLCFGGTMSETVNPLEKWIGKQGVVCIGPSKATPAYPDPRDNVQRFIVPAGQ